MRWLLCAAMLAGCGTKTCKDKTVLVSLTLSGASAGADTLDVSVVIGTQTLTDSVKHTGSATTGTLEIDFPNGYPAGQRADVTITARKSGEVVGVGSNGENLVRGCSTLAISLSSIMNDMAAPPGDLATADLHVPLDLTPSDLRACGHLREPCCAPNVCIGLSCYDGTCDMPDMGGATTGGTTATTGSTTGTNCQPVSTFDPVYVDPVNGTDDSMHGGMPGTCAYKTLSHALVEAEGVINLAFATYVMNGGGESGWVFQHHQEIHCSPDGTNRATLQSPGIFQVLGANVFQDCILVGGSGASSATIEIGLFADGGVQLNNCDISEASGFENASFAAIEINPAPKPVTIANCIIHNYASTNGVIRWDGNNTGTMTNNEFFNTPGATNIVCVSPAPNVTGAGNHGDGGATPTCSGCTHCPF